MITRIKERISLLRDEISATYVRLLTGDITCVTRGERLSFASAAIAGTMYGATGMVFASPITDAGDIARDLFIDFKTSITKIAGLMLGICIIWFLICTNEDDARRPLRWGKRIIIAYIIFMCMGAIFSFLGDKTEGKGFDDFF